MKPNSMAIFNSNDIFSTSADSTVPFVQHRDILALSGVDQEESILVLFPDSSQEKHREILFLKETSETIKIWEGEKLDKTSAFETSGIQTVYWLPQFKSILKTLVAEAQNIYINKNMHTRANTEMQTREDRFIDWIMGEYPALTYKQSAPLMHKVRSVKHPIEIELMQKACDITEKGVRRILPFIKPGVMEYNIEAELMHEFLNNRSKGFGWEQMHHFLLFYCGEYLLN